jgi:hypothetical protein
VASEISAVIARGYKINLFSFFFFFEPSQGFEPCEGYLYLFADDQ